jgi:hypothetical protein
MASSRKQGYVMIDTGVLPTSMDVPQAVVTESKFQIPALLCSGEIIMPNNYKDEIIAKWAQFGPHRDMYQAHENTKGSTQLYPYLNYSYDHFIRKERLPFLMVTGLRMFREE